VLGLDYDRLVVSHAARRYRQAQFVRGNLAALPVRSGVFDVIVTLQVIEHVWDHGQFLQECRRALRPGGLLLVTTPNRLTFSPGHDEPVNPFHTKEFTSAELTELMSAHGFDIGARYGVYAGARLLALDAAHGGSLVDAQLRAGPEDWPDRLRRDVASVVAGDFVVAAAELRDVDEALDLAVVAYRPA
jgi:SAM-dependent methyltransferase